MTKVGRPRVGKQKLDKIVPIKTDSNNFFRLRNLQLEAKKLVEEGKRNEEDVIELAESLRSQLHSYIDKLEDFVNN